AGLVVRRGELCFVVLNLFPYNPGHALVCPYRHVARYVDLRTDETAEPAHLTKATIRALEGAASPAGFNLGMNQGAVAGAGVEAHLHQHVVPRWGGDSNFFPVVARTKTLPMLLEDVRERLVSHWPAG
ncbi:MAG: HIT family protein, partial [Dermatophilaceae bacterium]